MSLMSNVGSTTGGRINFSAEIFCDNCGHSASNHYDGKCHKITMGCCGGTTCPCTSFRPRYEYEYPPAYPDPIYPNPIWTIQ